MRQGRGELIATAGAWVLALLCGVAVPVPAARAADACKAVAPQSESQRKFHPGHYVTISRGELRKGANVNSVLGKGVTGIQLRYNWADLERDEGRYDFTPIERDLAAATRAGLQLVAVIQDKSFNAEMPLPQYLHGKYMMRGKRGYTALRWDPYVVERMNALVAKLGEAFDCNPGFEGIAFQETALSVDQDVMQANGYSPQKYRDALEQVLRSATKSLPRSRVFWYMNFIPAGQQYIAEIAEDVAGTGVVMGGPDILPDNRALTRRTYPLYERFGDRMKLFGSMQNDSFRHRRAIPAPGGDPYWSMEDLYEYARDRLHVDYVFWEYRSSRHPADVRDWAEARDVIARHPTLSRAG
jgi:hypothetical protein